MKTITAVCIANIVYACVVMLLMIYEFIYMNELFNLLSFFLTFISGMNFAAGTVILILRNTRVEK